MEKVNLQEKFSRFRPLEAGRIDCYIKLVKLRANSSGIISRWKTNCFLW